MDIRDKRLGVTSERPLGPELALRVLHQHLCLEPLQPSPVCRVDGDAGRFFLSWVGTEASFSRGDRPTALVPCNEVLCLRHDHSCDVRCHMAGVRGDPEVLARRKGQSCTAAPKCWG